MLSYKEIDGDLIKLAISGEFDVIAHGCNCFCTMGAGIAPQMARIFGANIIDDQYDSTLMNNSEKLGNINWWNPNQELNIKDIPEKLTVINAYTQYGFGANHPGGTEQPLDYEALTLCMRKINIIFKGKTIGLPLIGCGLAGGDWDRVKQIIQNELYDMNIIIVKYNGGK